MNNVDPVKTEDQTLLTFQKDSIDDSLLDSYCEADSAVSDAMQLAKISREDLAKLALKDVDLTSR